jgi:hypothetical protein
VVVAVVIVFVFAFWAVAAASAVRVRRHYWRSIDQHQSVLSHIGKLLSIRLLSCCVRIIEVFERSNSLSCRNLSNEQYYKVLKALEGFVTAASILTASKC